MNKIYKYIGVSLLMLGIASCDESSWIPETEDGKGSLELSSLAIDIDDAEKVVTRATTDVNSFLISVTDKNGKDMGSWTYGDMPEILVLPTGNNYTLKVESHKIQDAEFEKPYFVGSANFDIQTGKITKIGEVVASFASLKVSIRFSDDFKSVSDNNAKVTVKGNNGSQLVYSINETRSGYFALGEATTFAAHFEGNINGVSTKEQTTFKDVNAGEHHILTYKIKSNPTIPDQSGNIGSDGSGIEIGQDYETVDKNGNVSVEEDYTNPSDRPGTEDPQDPENPGDDNKDPNNPDDPNEDFEDIVFSIPDGSLINFDKINFVPDFIDSEGNGIPGSAVIEIHSTKGINNFIVEIITQSEEFKKALEDMSIPNKFDLANPATEVLKETFKALQLPVEDEVKGEDNVTFDISSLVSLLFFKGEHEFKLTVTDKENNSLSKSVIFNQPEGL